MALSWNEIKSRAAAFALEWATESGEEAEAKSFYDAFFHIFGISRRRTATFEHSVRTAAGKQGFIDLLWKGVILIEHKSRGKNLDRAFGQAKDYFPGLKEAELPRYILVCDFEHFRLHDLETDERHDFQLKDLVQQVGLFGFIAGYQKRVYKDQDPVNIEAAEMMGRLHDQLYAIGYRGHALERYLVRLLFCLFADDTTIFEKNTFYDFIDQRTAPDGSDLARALAEFFEVLNTPPAARLQHLDEALAQFPYVNGALFEERLPMAAFDSNMRQALLDTSALDWGKISPAIFGSLFQSVMDAGARRNLGAHYTSEKNIMKVIKPLFMDALWTEFEGIKNAKNKLRAFHKKLAGLRFLDPACGCGNFLIIAYREVRLLETEVVRVLLKGQSVVSINDYLLVEVDHFYGIEYDEFPAQIAQVAMWLIDHQMNMLAGEAFGQYYVRLPLRKSATIVHGNSLRTDWQSLLSRDLKDQWAGESEDAPLRFDFILGNPPFVGHQWRNEEQMRDMENVFGKEGRSGRLDYVAAWYWKAAQYMAVNPITETAFVSTNSIVQGEQVAILWREMFALFDIEINFAHRTFSWSNEAKGNAAVHVVIVGFGKTSRSEKRLHIYNEIKGEPQEVAVANINGYLINGPSVFIEGRGKPIHAFPEMMKGSQPTDGGHLVLSEAERAELIQTDPPAEKWIRPYIGGYEFLNGVNRYCLWLPNADPKELRASPKVLNRIESVREARLKSPTPSVRAAATTPALFTQIRQPASNYIVVPEVSSENRKYIPMGFLGEDVIASNKLQIIPNGSLYLFGVLQSEMHMTWVRHLAGRLKSDYSYSPAVYNNFPWPQNPTEARKAAIEKAAGEVLDARAQFPNSSLADLYDPLTMPPLLVRAHAALDKAVDAAYRPQPFPDEARRMEFLFQLYEQYAGGLFVQTKRTTIKQKPDKND